LARPIGLMAPGSSRNVSAPAFSSFELRVHMVG
jgi:hypothetical protein